MDATTAPTGSRSSDRAGRRDDTPDAVVIGAGHNGLVAANLLADAGWDVLVCEATAHVGGAVRSAEAIMPGYVSDLFSAFYPLSIASPILNSLDLQPHGLHWTHSPTVLAHVFPDDRCAVLSRDVEQTAESVSAFAPGDGAAWRKLSQDWEVIREPLIQALFSPLPALLPVQRLLRKLGVPGALRLARMAAQPVRRMGEELFDGAGAPMLLAGNALHSDLPPEGAGSALYGWLLAMVGQSYGFPVPVGGAGRLAEALASRFIAAGGEIRLNSAVTEVELQGNIARAVGLAGGERIRARRAILADVAAPILFTQLVGPEHLPARFVSDLENFQWDMPTLKVNWALSQKIPWTAPGAVGAGTVHLGVDLDGLTQYAAELAMRRAPNQPFMLLGQMTTADPSRSPQGTESAWSYTHLPSATPITAEMVEAHVERMERTIERHAPGFGELVSGRLVQSPAALEQENPSLVHGSVNGGTAQLHQQLVFRPVPGLGGASTPIDRLYLAGASAHPGGGVHGGPGSNAARAALRRDATLGSGRRLAIRVVMKRLYSDSP
jgi:phytoene dehydrogenase-like protein